MPQSRPRKAGLVREGRKRPASVDGRLTLSAAARVGSLRYSVDFGRSSKSPAAQNTARTIAEEDTADPVGKGAADHADHDHKHAQDHTMPCHHAPAEALQAYINAAGIAERANFRCGDVAKD